MSTPSTVESRAEGKRPKPARKTESKTDKTKGKAPKAAREGRTATSGGSSATGSRSELERAILRAEYSNPGLSLGMLALSPRALQSSSSLGSVPERTVASQNQAHLQRHSGIDLFPVVLPGTNTEREYPEGGNGVEESNLHQRSTAMDAAEADSAAAASFQMRADGGVPPAVAPALEAFLNGEAFAAIQLLGDVGAQDDVTMFHHHRRPQQSHNQLHFRGEGEGGEGEVEGADGHNCSQDQNEGDPIALREDEASIKKGKSRQS